MNELPKLPTKDNSSFGSQLALIEDFQKELNMEKAVLLKKGMESSNAADLIDIANYLEKKEKKMVKKSFLFDPLLFTNSMNYKDRPYQLTYHVLRGMARTPIVQAITSTRVEQVASFGNFQEDEQKVGWTIRKRGRYILKDKNDGDLSDQDKWEVENLINFIFNGGLEKNRWGADSFDGFLRKITPDSLTLDQLTFEIIYNRKGFPHSFIATDGATYRLAESYNNEKIRPDQQVINGYAPFYVQIYQNLPRAEFYPWELCFGMRNPTTNIYNNGYGVSELENMIKIVTWMLYSDQYNGKFFSSGSSPKGIFKAGGNIDEDKLNEFRLAFRMQVSGVENAWKIPIMEGVDDLEWIDMQQTNADMQFTNWQEYLIRLACALYKIAPEEIGFYISGDNSVNYEGNNEFKLKYSKDKGLFPLLKFIQSQLTRYIIGPLSDYKYEFCFTGMDPQDQDKVLDTDMKKLESGMLSWFDIRRKYNLPTKLEEDDFLLNPMWLQMLQMKMQGAPGSNAFVDNMFQQNPFNQVGTGGAINNPFQAKSDNPFDPSKLVDEKDIEGNPFMKDLHSFVRKTLYKH